MRASRAKAGGPPSKRRKTTPDEDESVEYDKDEYEAALSDLAEEWSKGRRSRSQAVIKELMDKTAPQRRKWIEQDRPMVSDVLSKYPCLGHSRSVSMISLLPRANESES